MKADPLTRWLILAVLLGLAILLWLPFRFNVGFSGDEWYFYYHSSYTALWGQPSRPLIALPNVIAYGLSPGSFLGFNVMLTLVVFLRGALTYTIMRQIKLGRTFAFLTAALAMAIPADMGTYYMGAVAVYSSSVFYLLAVVVFLAYWKTRRLIFLILMINLQMLCLGIYEATYPLILVTPLLLLILHRRINRRLIMTAILWYLIPALNVLRYALLVSNQPEALGYQGGLLDLDVGRMISGTWGIFQRHFIDGWLPTRFAFDASFIPFALIAAAIVFVAVLRLSRPPTDVPMNRQTLLVIAITGIIILLLSVAIYIPTNARTDHLRTYYTSVIGAALTIVALLTLIASNRWVVAALVAGLCALGTLRLLEQGADFQRRSEAQQTILLNALDIAPDIAAWSGVIVLDETPNQLMTQRFMSAWTIQTTFQLIYADPTLLVVICPAEPNALNDSPRCLFEADGARVQSDDLFVWTRRYDELVLMRYTASGELRLERALPDHPTYNPFGRIDLEVSPSPMVQRMFADN